jgi:hypothetical protein
LNPGNYCKIKPDINPGINNYEPFLPDSEPKTYDNLYTTNYWNSPVLHHQNDPQSQYQPPNPDPTHDNLLQYPNYSRFNTPFEPQTASPAAISSPFSSINDLPQPVTKNGTVDPVRYQQNLHDPCRHWLESNISVLLTNINGTVGPNQVNASSIVIDNNDHQFHLSDIINNSLFPPGDDLQFDPSLSQALPNALQLDTKFSVIKYPSVNFIEEFESAVAISFKRINLGQQKLSHFRELYIAWLKQLLHRATFSKLYFHCLMSLSINYLLCTRYNSCPKYRMAANGNANASCINYSQFHDSERNMKAVWEIKSINYFHPIIQELRSILGKYPDLSAQVSYVLSLMSVYHHDASLDSLNCFRDGLFSILNYNSNPNISEHKQFFFIPVFQKLVTNTVRSVYLPGYNSAIIEEFHRVLTEFYNNVKSVCVSYHLEFVNLKLLDLIEFLNELLNVHIPIIELSLNDMTVQEKELFKILYKWVRFYPSELICKKSTFSPMESITFLFYISMKKLLFAIFPQIKFFFLRDFESPIVLDVFEFGPQEGYKLFKEELNNSPRNEIPHEEYATLLHQFKFITSYLVRLSSYFRTRLSILYDIMIGSANEFPVKGFGTWSASITSITECRQQFVQHSQFKETMITSFMTTAIQPQHYPRLLSKINENEPSPNEHLGDTNTNPVNFYSLTETGFLEVDHIPELNK